MTFIHAAPIVVVIAVNATSLGQTAFFRGVGDLPGGRIGSDARGVSADGRVVVGRSYSTLGEFGEAYRWTEIDGIVGLGDAPGGSWYSSAESASADGTVIVGQSYATETGSAVRWVNGNIEMLGDLGGDTPYSTANSVSADGRVVVGSGLAPFGTEAFRWTPNKGMVGLGDLPGGTHYSAAWDVSADGNTVVGVSRSEFGAFWGFNEAMRWTPQSGMTGLGDLPGSVFRSNALAVSADGLTIVGQGYGPFGNPAVSWSNGRAALAINTAGLWRSIGQATAVSGDGSVIVGIATTPDDLQELFFRTPYGVMRPLREVLVDDFGLNLTGWSLTAVTGISADGRTIVGTGTNPAGNQEGWVARLPPLCRADVNRDGRVDSNDIVGFALAMRAGNETDFNHDGLANSADFFDFLTSYFNGNGCE